MADAKSLSERQAEEAGIAPRNEVRQELIRWRNVALNPLHFQPDHAAFLSHVIWWLSDNVWGLDARVGETGGRSDG